MLGKIKNYNEGKDMNNPGITSNINFFLNVQTKMNDFE